MVFACLLRHSEKLADGVHMQTAMPKSGVKLFSTLPIGADFTLLAGRLGGYLRDPDARRRCPASWTLFVHFAFSFFA
jgi:hypothetical protein